MSFLAALAAIGLLSGVFLFVLGWRGSPVLGERTALRVQARPRETKERFTNTRLRVVLGVVSGIALYAATGWPVAGVYGVLGGFALPPLFLTGRTTKQQSDRLEAIASWASTLRDLMASHSGVVDAMIATADVAPEALREEITMLSLELRAGAKPNDALAHFQDAVGDAAMDDIVVALQLMLSHQVRNMPVLIERLAQDTQAMVEMRDRIRIQQTAPRTEARAMFIFIVVFILAAVRFDYKMVAVYGTPLGQLVLFAIGAIFSFGLHVMYKLSLFVPAPRIFATTGE